MRSATASLLTLGLLVAHAPNARAESPSRYSASPTTVSDTDVEKKVQEAAAHEINQYRHNERAATPGSVVIDGRSEPLKVRLRKVFGKETVGERTVTYRVSSALVPTQKVWEIGSTRHEYAVRPLTGKVKVQETFSKNESGKVVRTSATVGTTGIKVKK